MTWIVLLRNVQDFLAPTLAVAMVPTVALLVGRAKDRQPALAWWSLVFLVVSTATACYNGFFYPHYTIVIAPAVVAVGVVAAKGLTQRPAAVLVSSLMLVIAAWVMVVPILPKLESGTNAALAHHSLSPDAGAAYSKVGQALGRVMRPGDLIYTMDIHDYYLSRARLPTKFFFPSQLLKPSNASVLNSTPAAEVRKILAERPIAIVERASVKWPKQVAGLVDAYVRDRCTLAERVGGAAIYSCRTG